MLFPTTMSTSHKSKLDHIKLNISIMIQDIHSTEFIIETLLSGELRIVGRFLWGSNYTFLAEVQSDDETLAAVYKPSRGERPLWDFAKGSLAAREVVASLTSDELDWGLVPPTVLRTDGPVGPGSLQLYVDTNIDYHYFSFSDAEKDRLRPIAVFDLVINNADRKGGHVIIGTDDHIWSIDHGVSFHVEHKLRSVIWDFAMEPISKSLLADLEGFYDRLTSEQGLRKTYLDLLSETEIDALFRRIENILADPVFPEPTSQWSYPWPLV